MKIVKVTDDNCPVILQNIPNMYEYDKLEKSGDIWVIVVNSASRTLYLGRCFCRMYDLEGNLLQGYGNQSEKIFLAKLALEENVIRLN